MVMGYMCETHGFVHECDVNESGQRICKECEMAVTGVTGRTRGRQAPPADDPMAQHGDIYWWVRGYDGVDFTIAAFDYVDALERAVNRVKNPQSINEVMPDNLKYRR